MFVGFFEYVADRLDFSNDVPSVRTGSLLTNSYCENFARRHGMPPRQWTAYVCVEEPFDRTNAARAVVQRVPFDVILREFRNTREDLRDKKASLEELMGW